MPADPGATQRHMRRVRAVYGAGLIIAPGTMLAGTGEQDATAHERLFARVLGGRQIAEALLDRPRHPGRRMAGALVDATHAVTAAALARRQPRHARALHANAVIAAALALAGALTARTRT